MTFTLKGVTSNGTGRADASADAHRDGIPSVVDVCNVLSGRLSDQQYVSA
jgi:hypothetical protein